MPTGVKKTTLSTRKKLSRKSGLKKPKKIKNLVGYYWDGVQHKKLYKDDSEL